jgi:hypothetical protein
MEDVLLHLSDQDYFSPTRPISVSNQITATLEVTPVQLDGKRSKERQCDIIMKKANKVRDAFLQLHQPLIGEELIRASSEQINDSNNYPYEDYKQQMEELRNRCEELKNKKNAVADIISLLTLAPASWSNDQVASFFSVSVHLVKRAIILKREKGILSKPDRNKGRPMCEDEKDIVRDFYLSDDNSRMLPGIKDCVSVRLVQGNKKVKLQKRLLLMNIDELYVKYKEYCVTKLCLKSCGRTKFFELRPVNVIDVGVGGSHNVCVCEKHQNVKLMIDSVCGSKEDKYLLMDKIVCDTSNHACMFKKCQKCPGSKPLFDFLTNLTSDKQQIKFNQWETTDRSTLLYFELTASDFIDLLVKKIDALTTHHLIAKEQSKFCKELKKNCH